MTLNGGVVGVVSEIVEVSTRYCRPLLKHLTGVILESPFPVR